MTSVFSSMVLPSAKRQASQEETKTNDENLFTHTLIPEEPDLRVLNNALRALLEVFPNVQPEVLREMLARVSETSRLEIVTEQLLKNETKWVQGRYRREGDAMSNRGKVTARQKSQRVENMALPREETFRNQDYKFAVKEALYDEFKGLSHSTIKAVLAECNYHYTPARTALLSINSKSWRSSLTNFFFRRKTPSVDHHPLLTWSSGSGTLASSGKRQRALRLVPTKNAELNQELYEDLLAPALAKEREAQEIVDHALAHQLFEQEATEAGEEYDCECCYSTVTINHITVCNDGGHFLCFRCVTHTINEAIYGQGWTKSIDLSTGTLRCMAPLSVGECNGCVPLELVRRAVEDKDSGKQTMQRLHDRVASESLLQSKLQIVHCPFCSYAEVDELSLRSHHIQWSFRNPKELGLLSAWAIFMLASSWPNLFEYLLPLTAVAFLLSYYLPNPFMSPLIRMSRKARGLRFTCQSPLCGKQSCLHCHSLWRDVHECYSSQLSNLQQALESAMTGAIKRTCPKCNMSFVKSAGCNKLVCVCGYQMCYLCRADLGQEGYHHFCQHFRANGGQCKECEKCDLYRNEDETAVIKKARGIAEKEWWSNEGKGVSKDLVARTQPLLGVNWWDWSVWENWIDMLVERLVLVRV
ncbi:hypothetical protein EG328_011880 [Venturia inaequalis]|uniref:RING-type domain-containing protein n=1 Tax=Venturia inaequalis TaxID=5025 RepID=A0A8H3Z2S3_VENIN|nr:hypothetical protein EG328_011880 [Venturia inaequalis]RDI78678.1 hypothetical protein Vi05172_g11271 [Venturia inaequalis]